MADRWRYRRQKRVFFQAADGMRDLTVTGVQTCALPILSDVGRWFAGGLIAHLPALTALTCGSVNGFRRLVPRSWAGAYACHGPDNREAAIRVCSPMEIGRASCRERV